MVDVPEILKLSLVFYRRYEFSRVFGWGSKFYVFIFNVLLYCFYGFIWKMSFPAELISFKSETVSLSSSRYLASSLLPPVTFLTVIDLGLNEESATKLSKLD
jgi:hypothetical protein